MGRGLEAQNRVTPKHIEIIFILTAKLIQLIQIVNETQSKEKFTFENPLRQSFNRYYLNRCQKSFEQSNEIECDL